MKRGIVAQFHKSAGGRLTLFSLTTLTEEVCRADGERYISRLEYDVDYSRKYGYVFHLSGSGGGHVIPVSGIYFVSGDAKVKEGPCQLVHGGDKPPWRSRKTRAIRERNRTRRLRKAPKAFDIEPGLDLLDWLQNNAIESSVEYCSICRDYLPTCDTDHPCEHIWWCETFATWSTPSERMKDCDDRECECEERKTTEGATHD